MRDLVAQVFHPHLVDGVSAPANYSLQLAGHDPEQPDATFHFLYRGFNPVIRTSDPRRLFEGLRTFLEGHLVDRGDGLVRLDAMALVGRGRAVLAPADSRHLLGAFERRLNVGGLRVLDRMWATIDPTDGHLVVDEPILDIDEPALSAGLDHLPPARRPDPPVEPGRYPITGWAFGLGEARSGPILGAEAVVNGARLAVNTPSVGSQGVLDAVSKVMATAPVVALWVDDPTELATPLLELAG